MAVHYKFKSAKDYDSIPIEGHFISVSNLKEKIVEKMKLGRASDFDLLISNAQTSEEYSDEGFLVPKNTSVLVRRVPGKPRLPIVADVREEHKAAEDSSRQSALFSNGLETSQRTAPEVPDWMDEFGVDLYEEPEVLQNQPVINKADEDSKIKAFVDASASDWQRQTQETFSGGRGFGRGGQGRGAGGRGFGHVFQKRTPPQGYVCHRCGVTGHYIQHCPTNGDPTYDMKKVKLPTGIPKTMLVANPDGSYALPNGQVAVLKPNEAVFEKEIDGFPSTRMVGDIPPEFRCPLCRDVLKDAVLTSKCCFKSYCDRCIREQIMSKGKCICGATNILADDLLPNKTLREAIDRLLESTTMTTSAENAGSKVQIQDMESAPLPRPKATSPAASASVKESQSTMRMSDTSNIKERTMHVKLTTSQAPSATDASGRVDDLEAVERTPESVTTKEPASQEEAVTSQGKKQPADEEVQQEHVPNRPVRRNKARRMRPPVGHNIQGHQPHWRGMPHPPMAEGPMIPYGGNAVPYNGFWPSPQAMGEAYMMPYGGNFTPYGPYATGPYDMPYNVGLMGPDPYGPQGGMVPAVPFQRPANGVMSREEFEAKKAELKRKREMEKRLCEREQANPLSRSHGMMQPRDLVMAGDGWDHEHNERFEIDGEIMHHEPKKRPRGQYDDAENVRAPDKFFKDKHRLKSIKDVQVSRSDDLGTEFDSFNMDSRFVCGNEAGPKSNSAKLSRKSKGVGPEVHSKQASLLSDSDLHVVNAGGGDNMKSEALKPNKPQRLSVFLRTSLPKSKSGQEQVDVENGDLQEIKVKKIRPTHHHADSSMFFEHTLCEVEKSDAHISSNEVKNVRPARSVFNRITYDAPSNSATPSQQKLKSKAVF
ncbi:hypothetical protein O6H91_04G103900 [Diphasiastrum complanatum]|uniref:Uncharacterized protein n=1 Tax=Diphasiastrum complanatum TaxID=34168 RepID=A0ACC2E005_DIPCM|nr:hypothetical protein O6H91_04G103900 [Diphasiastrum complanatum]